MVTLTNGVLIVMTHGACDDLRRLPAQGGAFTLRFEDMFEEAEEVEVETVVKGSKYMEDEDEDPVVWRAAGGVMVGRWQARLSLFPSAQWHSRAVACLLFVSWAAGQGRQRGGHQAPCCGETGHDLPARVRTTTTAAWRPQTTLLLLWLLCWWGGG